VSTCSFVQQQYESSKNLTDRTTPHLNHTQHNTTTKHEPNHTHHCTPLPGGPTHYWLQEARQEIVRLRGKETKKKSGFSGKSLVFECASFCSHCVICLHKEQAQTVIRMFLMPDVKLCTRTVLRYSSMVDLLARACAWLSGGPVGGDLDRRMWSAGGRVLPHEATLTLAVPLLLLRWLRSQRAVAGSGLVLAAALSCPIRMLCMTLDHRSAVPRCRLGRPDSAASTQQALLLLG
jgi:hypothetical protein